MSFHTPPPAFLMADSEALMLSKTAWKQAELLLVLRFIHVFQLGNHANINESQICKIKYALDFVNMALSTAL